MGLALPQIFAGVLSVGMTGCGRIRQTASKTVTTDSENNRASGRKQGRKMWERTWEILGQGSLKIGIDSRKQATAQTQLQG